jgi:hypothetical protein|tara:strand:- start:717 stop:854 length:138 start_codon:yes stop_codon:yes gene_type:complete
MCSPLFRHARCSADSVSLSRASMKAQYSTCRGADDLEKASDSPVV